MSDEQIIKQMIESKAEQSLREHINEGKEFDNTIPANSIALNKYNQMTESEKENFKKKGWVND